MRRDNSGSVRRSMSGQRVCKLCGNPFPLEGIEQADTCSQWTNYFVRNLPDPGNVAVILTLSLLDRFCILNTSINRGIHAIEHLEDVSLDFSDKPHKG